jgi:DNA gyrase subunit A
MGRFVETASPTPGAALIEQELKDAYLNYAMSVIVSRALPDVRDGLKPSQRRILTAMNDLNLGPAAKFRKCAKIAGDTSGNYHPHGEQVVYPTLVRLAQAWAIRYGLVDGQGNFGSIDGDPPAAMRYTEARLTGHAAAMLEDLELDTVDFVPNYDETRQEPTVLPGRLPNLLVNGASGIAVGMATSIPPHNLGEICDALTALLDNPNLTSDELMKFVPGPDFPTGGIVCGARSIRESYATGRGLLRVRARIRQEDHRGRAFLVVTEIPYGVNKKSLIEQIAEMVKTEQLQGVSDVRDESDREGMRIVLELGRGQDADVVLNQLYASTPLQETFGANMIALVDGRPRLLGLRDLMQAYLGHRRDVVRRRTRTLLAAARKDEHVHEGLVRALDLLDQIIALIRASKDAEAARAGLTLRFGFSVEQADAILRMTLQRLTGLERQNVAARLAELRDQIRDYEQILADEARVRGMLKDDLAELKAKFGDARRTQISPEEIEAFEIEELVPEEQMAVVLTHQGYIKRVPLDSYRQQRRGGRGVIGADMREADFVEHLFVANTHDTLLFFTERGRVHWLKVYDVPVMERSARGKQVGVLLGLAQGERIHTAIPVRDFAEGFLVMATRSGTAKKTALSAFANPRRGGIIAITLAEQDRLIGVRATGGEDEVVLATAGGCAIRFHERRLRPMGRAAAGVAGIRLEPDDAVVDMAVVDPRATLLTLCERGFGKRSAFGDYRLTGRGGKGVINVKTTQRNGRVVGVKSVRDEDEVMVMTQAGMVVRTRVKDISTMGRATQGVRVIKLDEGDRVVSLARVEPEREGEGEQGSA